MTRMTDRTLTEGLRVNVSQSTRRRLEEMAERDDRSVAAVIRRAIREYLDRQQEEA